MSEGDCAPAVPWICAVEGFLVVQISAENFAELLRWSGSHTYFSTDAV